VLDNGLFLLLQDALGWMALADRGTTMLLRLAGLIPRSACPTSKFM